MKRIRLWLINHWRWYRHRSLYVLADPKDNSVTLSRGLFDTMDLLNQQEAKVFVFKLCNYVPQNAMQTGDLYAFMLNPSFEEPTQLCDVQYNSKHRTIGFETLCPTVNRIFYDYGLRTVRPVKLSVETHLVPDGFQSDKKKTVYIIMPPYDKHTA